MSGQRLQRKASLFSLVIILVAVIITGVLISFRQQIIDTVRASQFTPSQEVGSIRSALQLTHIGELYFNSSQPRLQSAAQFNKNCPQSEPNNPVVGCYANQQIFIYNVTNQQLDGIEETTAAHELLHAAYERMSDNERETINAALQKAYRLVKTKELESRMEYYEKNEPGEENNELHSILGTEYSDLGPALEEHYEKYFSNRKAVVSYYKKYQVVFTGITTKLDSLAKAINTRSAAVSAKVSQYNSDQAALNNDIKNFGNREFSSQDEYDSARGPLLRRQNALESRRDSLNKEINAINALREEYNALKKEYEALTRSINSSLEPAPKLES